jgi:hypothetical protein
VGRWCNPAHAPSVAEQLSRTSPMTNAARARRDYDGAHRTDRLGVPTRSRAMRETRRRAPRVCVAWGTRLERVNFS